MSLRELVPSSLYSIPCLSSKSGVEGVAQACGPSFASGLATPSQSRRALAHSPSEKPAQPLSEVLKNAGRRALGGGVPGAAAMGIQVLSLMWLRTTVNYQYRYGTTTTVALKTLYKEGGVVRFYRGLGPALVQGPLSRFGDTAANAGVLTLLNEHSSTRDMPIALKTAAASAAAGGFRIFLMPVDAMKTIMQVEGKGGFGKLAAKVRVGGPSVLYHGAIAAAAATWAGHYPWFFTYNYLDAQLPRYDELHKKLLRSAVIGFSASAISDTISNSIRVVKTTKQTATTPMTYPQVVRMVVKEDGVLGLMGRGLKTKILANGLQGLLFSVLWRIGQDYWNKMEAK
ncbi:hypothetical protein H632_c685p1 [Helicosporidium sp. ATCC 50920]|nr:hypothetical protein H632_c685p1 [Helicosporidium sp. ATCC 50920]|eukprot:KDD75437.1 hypothetical protein H632_c685p1 [Helicosporidium sp. ATCC 50920]